VRATRGGRLIRVVVAAPGVELGFGAVMAWWKGGLVESEKCVTELKVGRRGRGKHEEHERRSQ
jgi:hypothetical protein